MSDFGHRELVSLCILFLIFLLVERLNFTVFEMNFKTSRVGFVLTCTCRYILHDFYRWFQILFILFSYFPICWLCTVAVVFIILSDCDH